MGLCDRCDEDRHACHGCGRPVTHDYRNPDGTEHKCPSHDARAVGHWMAGSSI
jgi:hypothetical protein